MLYMSRTELLYLEIRSISMFKLAVFKSHANFLVENKCRDKIHTAHISRTTEECQMIFECILEVKWRAINS